MKKFTCSFSVLIAMSAGSLFAAPPSAAPSTTAGATPPTECSQLTQPEQDFATQLMDVKNKSMFCRQFTPDQRAQAMQMMGQPDSNGNPMSADQAVVQVMGSGAAPRIQQKSSPIKGGCPTQ